MTLAEAKAYLRIDDSADDEILQGFIDSAIVYSERQTGKKYDAENPLWKLLIKRYCARWNENRGDNFNGSMTEDPSIEMILNHIALCGDYE